jgi:hypothetical protein
MHLNHVAFWVLAALAASLLLMRLAGLAFYREALASHVVDYPSPRRLALYAALASIVVGLTGYQAIKPDVHFHKNVGRAAVEAGDFPGVVVYFEPLVAWGSRDFDVHFELGRAYLALGRPARAVPAFEGAVAIDGASVPARVFCAEALVRSGAAERALPHLRTAADLVGPGPAREAILGRIRGLERGSGAN